MEQLKEIVGVAIITFILSVFSTWKLVIYKIDEIKLDVKYNDDKIKELETKHYTHNRELGEVKQLLNTTNDMLKDIHTKMFHGKE